MRYDRLNQIYDMDYLMGRIRASVLAGAGEEKIKAAIRRWAAAATGRNGVHREAILQKAFALFR